MVDRKRKSDLRKSLFSISEKFIEFDKSNYQQINNTIQV